MKKEFEPGNVKEIIDSIPERNLEKEDDIDKEAHRLEGCLYFLRGYMGEMQNCIRNGCIPAQILLSFWML
ncbi:MAG: hypothetical protein ACLVAO_10010 [Clostridium fessum]